MLHCITTSRIHTNSLLVFACSATRLSSAFHTHSNTTCVTTCRIFVEQFIVVNSQLVVFLLQSDNCGITMFYKWLNLVPKNVIFSEYYTTVSGQFIFKFISSIYKVQCNDIFLDNTACTLYTYHCFQKAVNHLPGERSKIDIMEDSKKVLPSWFDFTVWSQPPPDGWKNAALRLLRSFITNRSLKRFLLLGYPVQQQYTIFFLQQEDGFHGQQVIKLKLFPFINWYYIDEINVVLHNLPCLHSKTAGESLKFPQVSSSRSTHSWPWFPA